MTRFGLWIFMSKITHDFWLCMVSLSHVVFFCMPVYFVLCRGDQTWTNGVNSYQIIDLSENHFLYNVWSLLLPRWNIRNKMQSTWKVTTPRCVINSSIWCIIHDINTLVDVWSDFYNIGTEQNKPAYKWQMYRNNRHL
jgi:hypothetical protein